MCGLITDSLVTSSLVTSGLVTSSLVTGSLVTSGLITSSSGSRVGRGVGSDIVASLTTIVSLGLLTDRL